MMKQSKALPGLEDKSSSPPPGDEDDGGDDLAQALAANELETQKTRAALDKRTKADKEEVRKAMAANELENQKIRDARDQRIKADREEIRKAMAANELENQKIQDTLDQRNKADKEEIRKAMAASRYAATKASADTETAEEKELRKAMKASKNLVHDSPRSSQDNEEEMQRAMELSKLESHPPALPDASDDEDFKRILEASMKEAADHEQRLKEAREGKKREKEIVEESKRTVQDDKKKRLEAAKVADEDYQKQRKEAMWENIAEYKAKKVNRKNALAYRKKREIEIAEEERERIRLEREQLARANNQDATAMRASGQRSGGRYGGRPGGLQPVLEDMTPEEAEQIRQAEALSLGDQGPGSTPTVTEVGWGEENTPPSYPEINRRENRKILDPELWTTSTRDIALPGKKIPMTPEVKNEMIQHGARINVQYGEKNESPDAPKPPKYKRTGKSEEKKALAAMIKPSKQTQKSRTTDIVDDHVRGNLERDFGHRMAPQFYDEVPLARMDDETRRQTREAQIRGNRNAFRNNPISRLF
ncbi:hypothetical protein G7Y79_00001g003440 [Physcia stellaris]|nr:hypothetical protein G7Y79_00001g003440 [Physcia stellaris]